VTVFNRGLHGAVPGGVLRLRGDRSAPDGLSALVGGEWDLVVDTWDGEPRAVLNAAGALVGPTGHYIYVSSRSVYREPVALGADERTPVVDAASDALDGSYAELKAGGERAAREIFGERALIARAGLILGPGEDIGRLPWWLQRVARGGQVLAPGPADLPLQYIDVRDLVTWLLDLGRERVGGTFNVVSRTGHATMGELLAACVGVTGARATLRWVDLDRSLRRGWCPGTICRSGSRSGMRSGGCRTAMSAGRTRQGCAAARWRRRSPTRGGGFAPSAGCHRAPAARNGSRWAWTRRVRPNLLARA
jgi:2'-hydroxyisoflavone reductase